MAKEYVPIFFDWLEVTQDLSSEEKGNLIDAVVAYASGEEYEHLLTGGCRIAFRFLKGQVDRNNAISDKRGDARKKKEEQNETNENKREQKQTNLPKEKEKEKEKENKKQKQKQNGERFERFWAAYPRKTAKPDARRKFESIDPDEDLLKVMLDAIEKQKRSDQWTKDGGQFIPYPATWLNQRRWEDEVQPAKPVKVLPAQQYEQRDYSGVQAEIESELDREMEEYMKSQRDTG